MHRNERQINLAVRLYADDHGDIIGFYTNTIYFDYKEDVVSYLRLGGTQPATNAVFVCAADNVCQAHQQVVHGSFGYGFCNQSWTHFSSYWVQWA